MFFHTYIFFFFFFETKSQKANANQSMLLMYSHCVHNMTLYIKIDHSLEKPR